MYFISEIWILWTCCKSIFGSIRMPTLTWMSFIGLYECMMVAKNAIKLFSVARSIHSFIWYERRCEGGDVWQSHTAMYTQESEKLNNLPLSRHHFHFQFTQTREMIREVVWSFSYAVNTHSLGGRQHISSIRDDEELLSCQTIKLSSLWLVYILLRWDNWELSDELCRHQSIVESKEEEFIVCQNKFFHQLTPFLPSTALISKFRQLSMPFYRESLHWHRGELSSGVEE